MFNKHSQFDISHKLEISILVFSPLALCSTIIQFTSTTVEISFHMLSLMACCSIIMHSLHLSQLKSTSTCFCLHPYHSHSVIFIILKPSLHMLLQMRFTAKANTLRHTMPRRINMYLSTSELAQVYTLQCILQKAASHLKRKLAERESTHNGVN